MIEDQQKEIVKGALEFVYYAIQEALKGNNEELMAALGILELMREN